ncbi:MAG: hypothetical protein Q7R35_13025 [Elusimicrobiota bacterium]|nr:hypothetical protein [Elusimicrobiota bacterium]
MDHATPVYLNAVNLLKGALYSFIAVLTILALGKYPGAAHIYILFTLVFNLLLFAGFRKKRIFFDTFTGMFLWLGFWLKLSFTLVFFGGQFGEPVGNFSFTGPAFDFVLNLSSCAALALLLASLLREKFFTYSVPGAGKELSALESFYFRFRTPIWVVYTVSVILISVSNAYFGFYQKGLPPRTVLPFGLSGVYTLAILFGMASVSAVLLNCEFKLKKTSYLPSVLALMECFFSNVSMLSRGMILNGTALLIGVFENARLQAIQFSLRFKTVIICAFLGLFIGSVFTVNYVRTYAFADSADSGDYVDSELQIRNILKNNKIIATIISATRLNLFINRWVGVEGVMSVTSYNGLGWDLWNAGWLEKYSSSGTSLYDKTIIKDSPYLPQNTKRKHFITLPGIIAFFYYPGSVVFLIIMMFALGLFGACVEVAVYKLSGANVVLCALLGQVVAGRYVHFGYVPRQSYLLFGGIFLISFSLFALNKAIPFITTAPSPRDK